MRPTDASTLRGGVYVVESARPGATTTTTNDGEDDGPRPVAIWRGQVLYATNAPTASNGRSAVGRREDATAEALSRRG